MNYLSTDHWNVYKPNILWKDTASHLVFQYLIDYTWKNVVAQLYLNIILHFRCFIYSCHNSDVLLIVNE